MQYTDRRHHILIWSERNVTEEHIQLYELTKLVQYILKIEVGGYDSGNAKVKAKLDEIDTKWKIKVK